MNQKTSHSNKKLKVSALRDSPHGYDTETSLKKPKSEICGDVVAFTNGKGKNLIGSEGVVGVANHNYHKPKEEESFDLVMKRAGFNMAVNGRRFDPLKRKFHSPHGSKVKILSSEESKKLYASVERKRHGSGNIQRKSLLAKAVMMMKEKKKKKKFSSADVLRLKANAYKVIQHRYERHGVKQENQITKVPSPREKVKIALRLFKLVLKELDCDEAARRSESKTSRIDCYARTVVMEMGEQVNQNKMIGPVPGIEVGDKFQYKVELEIIGLHFEFMGGIDYMYKGSMILATSIVSADNSAYEDRFEDDTLIYTGEGGNMMSKDPKQVEDQKMVKGNLALYNSMRKKTQVRVIRGEKWDQRGKNYVYDGLYLVKEHWEEKGPQGNILFKFKLCRVHGQPLLFT
ncbi:YDG domain-containing protein [Cardamine amara subsp. amara]|uniref:YDG domain-containing protein n=1 Tax=Cardamine amara subsp. amara TaxID=228776 RepID=A0ABD1BG34_CARAN